MRTALTVALMGVAISATLAPMATAQTAAEQIQQSCETSFTTEGSFLRGRTFRGNAVAPGVDMSTAVQRIARTLALQGNWRDIQGDRDIGTVTALMGVGGNDSAVTSLNVVVEDSPEGARMNAVFSARGGLMVRLEPLREMVCGALAGAAG